MLPRSLKGGVGHPPRVGLGVQLGYQFACPVAEALWANLMCPRSRQGGSPSYDGFRV